MPTSSACSGVYDREMNEHLIHARYPNHFILQLPNDNILPLGFIDGPDLFAIY